jgi:hypothetical protein
MKTHKLFPKLSQIVSQVFMSVDKLKQVDANIPLLQKCCFKNSIPISFTLRPLSGYNSKRKIPIHKIWPQLEQNLISSLRRHNSVMQGTNRKKIEIKPE